MFFTLGDELPLFTIDVVLTWTRLHGARFEAELRRHYIIKQDEMIFFAQSCCAFRVESPSLNYICRERFRWDLFGMFWWSLNGIRWWLINARQLRHFSTGISWDAVRYLLSLTTAFYVQLLLFYESHFQASRSTNVRGLQSLVFGIESTQVSSRSSIMAGGRGTASGLTYVHRCVLNASEDPYKWPTSCERLPI